MNARIAQILCAISPERRKKKTLPLDTGIEKWIDSSTNISLT
jgi:hypothetical protein